MTSSDDIEINIPPSELMHLFGESTPVWGQFTDGEKRSVIEVCQESGRQP